MTMEVVGQLKLQRQHSFRRSQKPSTCANRRETRTLALAATALALRLLSQGGDILRRLSSTNRTPSFRSSRPPEYLPVYWHIYPNNGTANVYTILDVTIPERDLSVAHKGA